MTSDGRIFVARQPILDARRRIAGYELLYRSSAEASRADFLDVRAACLRTLISVFVDIGADALLGSRLGFVNVVGELLRADPIEALPKDRVVLEILESEVSDAPLRLRCQEMRQRGFALALDDYVPGDERQELLPLVDYVKVDLLRTHPSALRRLVHELRRHPVCLVAEKVESAAQYDLCRELGFDLFQGYHFARPVTLSGASVDPARAALLDLLRLLRQEAELESVEEPFKQHATLGLNLLRLVNSVGRARSQKISTVRQALVLVGRRQLERWLMLLLFAGSDPAGTSSPLLELAAARGRLMELLAARMGAAAASQHGAQPGDRAFLVGMLSLVDAVLQMPKQEVLERLNVDEEIRVAVVERERPLGWLLALSEALEQGDFAAVAARLDGLGLSADGLLEAELETSAWVRRLECGEAD